MKNKFDIGKELSNKIRSQTSDKISWQTQRQTYVETLNKPLNQTYWQITWDYWQIARYIKEAVNGK